MSLHSASDRETISLIRARACTYNLIYVRNAERGRGGGAICAGGEISCDRAYTAYIFTQCQLVLRVVKCITAVTVSVESCKE